MITFSPVTTSGWDICPITASMACCTYKHMLYTNAGGKEEKKNGIKSVVS